jgi:antagonist of KipI
LAQPRPIQISENQMIKEPSWGILVSAISSSIRIFQGPEWDRFTDDSKHHLIERTFKISPDSNRMGYRLNGQSLKLRDGTELISTPVNRGTIQVTNDGTPIILMADAQTIGGYPRIAQVAAVDIPRLAQKRPGESIKFEFISYDEGCRLFLERGQEWRKTETSILLKQK